MKRPILYVLIFFCIGILTASLLQIPIFYSVLVSAAFMALSILASKKRLLSHASLYLAIFFLGVAHYDNSNILAPGHIAKLIAKEPRQVHLKGLIVDDPVSLITPYNRQKTTFTLKSEYVHLVGVQHVAHLRGVHWRMVSGLVRVNAYSDKAKALSFGDEVFLEGFISKPHGVKNPGSFNYSEYLKIRDIYAVLRVKEGFTIEITKRRDASYIKRGAYLLRHFIRDSLDRYLREPYRGFTTGILIGDRSALDEGINDDFVKTGTVHILAISGLNVAMIAVFILGVLGLAGIPKKLNLVITLCVLIIYSFAAGASPPIVRAVIIYAIFVIGYLLKRDSEGLNSLSIAAGLILLWNPKELFDPSFQLSFVSVASIIVLYPRFKKIRNPGSYLIKSAWASIAAWIGTWPVIAVYFNIISPVSLAANLIIIPLSFAVMAASFIFLSASAVSPFLASTIASGLCLIEQAIFFINHLLAGLPFSYFRIGAPSAGFLTLYYISVALLILPSPIRLGRLNLNRRRIAIILLLAFNMFVWKDGVKPARDGVEAVFFDVGEGDSILIKLSNKGNILIDGGPARIKAFDTGRLVIAPYLWNNGISYIDAVIVTHFHNDHAGGLLYILNNFRVGCVVDNGLEAEGNSLYDKYVKNIRRKHIRRIAIEEGDVMNFGHGAKFYILNPQDTNRAMRDPNDDSIVSRFVYKNFSILLCGDITENPMARLINLYGDFLRSDIIKIPHHGRPRNEGITKDFLNTVSPKASIVSGERAVHSADYTTAEKGAITVSAKSKFFKIESYSLGHRPRDLVKLE